MVSIKDKKRQPSVIIIGAGMTGMLMLIKLREMGVQDVIVLEKKASVGGTWRENTYPGVACDIPAHMYTYSFEPNPEWSHRFARGDEIQDYFERVAHKYGLYSAIRFNAQVTGSYYDASTCRWKVSTADGESLEADFLISATGILHHPALPDIKGRETFQGASFHTAEWDHSVELKGKRIGVIGTGSTACQAIPELVKLGAKVSVFQRTPQWIVNVPDRDYTEQHKDNCRRNPGLMHRLRRLYTMSVEQIFSKAVTGHKLQHGFVSLMCKLNLWRSVKDPELRAKLTPDYKVGCKRLIANGTFYPAIQQANAELVTEGIQQIEEAGVRTDDGRLHELDVLVFSTGFHPFNFMRPMAMQGKNGADINDVWADKVQAYRSLFIPDFPNFFLMLGPNTPIGNFSVIAMSEVQCHYVLQCIAKWCDQDFDEIDAKPDALQAFNAYLKQGMSKTVWVGGCNSWYLDKDGDPAMWPYTWKQWVKEMSEPQWADFRLSRKHDNQVGKAA